MKPFTFIALLIFGIQGVFPQQQIELAHSVKEVIINANTGTLLARTGEVLYGISPSTKQIIWENPSLGKVDFTSYKEVPFTPLVIFENKPVVNSKLLANTVNAKGISRKLVNSNNGKVLFDSQKAGFSSVNRTLILPEIKAILVDGIREKETAIALYSIDDQQMLWQNKLTNATFFNNLKGTLFNREMILLDRNQNVFWLRNNQLLHIASDSGKILFEQGNVASIDINATKELLYLFTNADQNEELKKGTAIMAYNVTGMQPMWKTPTQIRGSLREVAFEGKTMIAITSFGFNILDDEGAKQWKDLEPLPLIKQIVPIGQGYLVVQEKFLQRIGEDGKKVWKTPLKIALANNERPVYLFEKDTTAIYISPSRANKIAISNGEKYWDDLVLNDADYISRNLKLKVPLHRVWYDSIAKQYPVYSDNKLYLLNAQAATAPQALHTFDFGRSLPYVQIRDYGYLISNNNRFFLFDTTGNLVYKREYPAAESTSVFRSSWYYIKRGLGTYRAATSFIYNQAFEGINSTLASGNLGVLTNIGSGIYGSYQLYQNPRSVVSNLEELGFDSGLRNVFKRIQKGKDGQDSMLIVAPKEDGTKEVIRLQLPTGNVESLRKLGKERKFVIDQIENVIYLYAKNSIRIEQL